MAGRSLAVPVTGCDPRSRDPDGRLDAVPAFVAPVRAEEPDATRDDEGSDEDEPDDVLEPPREEAEPVFVPDELGVREPDVREPDEGCARCGSGLRSGSDGRMVRGSGADDPEEPEDPAEPDPGVGRGIA